MIRILVVFLFFAQPFFVFAQVDTTLKTYYVSSKIDDDCSANIVITFFNESQNLHRVNQAILDEAMRGYYDTRESQINLKNIYANSVLQNHGEFFYTIGVANTFHKNGLYSFISCPYNVCDKAPRSNFESNFITVDIKSLKILTINDIIDPLKRDSFEKYVYYTTTRYHIKNVPSCYITSYNPPEVRGSNNVTVMTDTITYFKGITDKFYLKDDRLYVFNKAKHRDYNYNSVEVFISLFYAKYFLKPEMVERLGLR